MNAQDIEIVIADFFCYRANVIVPNISWGMGLMYEADVVVLRPSGYADEIEIKTSLSDIKADLKKRHQHDSNLFRRLWFAVPEKLADSEFIPQRAGVLAIGKRRATDNYMVLETVRGPKINKHCVKWSNAKRRKFLELGSMRIWTLKQCLQNQRRIK